MAGRVVTDDHQCVDGSRISPRPWRVVRHPTPYYTQIMDATGGTVCMGFGTSDENVLLAAPDLLDACREVFALIDRWNAKCILAAAIAHATGEGALRPEGQHRMEGLTEGRMVHFVMPDGQHRPAIVVRVWNKESGYVNLQVLTDGINDGLGAVNGIMWQTSVMPDEDAKPPRTWHWIERA